PHDRAARLPHDREPSRKESRHQPRLSHSRAGSQRMNGAGWQLGGEMWATAESRAAGRLTPNALTRLRELIHQFHSPGSRVVPGARGLSTVSAALIIIIKE